MSDDEYDRILGTRVPDTPIHRASMWLEDLRFGDRRRDAGVETVGDDDWQRFIDATDAPFTVEQMKEAATYYGTNNLQMLTGGRVEMVMPSPTGQGVINLRAIFISLWLDAFMHGVAAAEGKTGLSNAEIDAKRLLDPTDEQPD